MAQKRGETPIVPTTPSAQPTTPVAAAAAQLAADAVDYPIDVEEKKPVAKEAKPEVKDASKAAASSDKVEEIAQDAAEDASLDDELGTPDVPAAENFKKLRTKAKEAVKSLRAIQAEKAELEKKLALYDSGAVVPEVLQEKENRIAELTHYEKLHNLKMSPEYQEAFIKPLSEAQGRLFEIAKDYGIPNDVISQALNIENRAELNRFLSEHFDDVGALEVKGLLGKAKEIQNKAKAAEAEPARVFADLQEEHKKISEARTQQRKASIADKSKDAWVKSLVKIRQEGKVQELIMNENDPERNAKVKPILTAAASEYGKLVRVLADSGLEYLSDEAAEALARMVQLAHASAIAIETREAVIKHADELERNTKRTANYMRPAIGSPSSSGPGPSQGVTMPSSPQGAAQMLLNKVLSGTRG